MTTFGASGPGLGRGGHQLSEPANVRPTVPSKPSYGPAGCVSATAVILAELVYRTDRYKMAADDPSPLDVLVVGAGITGIYQLHRALEEGFTAALVEAGDGVGGTWFWNRYPGARFDSESYTYGYFFSEELFDEWEWQEHFAGQPEVERYLNHVVDRFDLRRHMRFGARVTSAVWDDIAGTWSVTTDDGMTVRARYVVSATGVLSVPYTPDVPGRATFRGIQHHTGWW